MGKSAAKSGSGAAATQTFRNLVIDRRVLTAPARTISIRNIATLSVGTHAEPRTFTLLLLAILFALMAAGALTQTSPFNAGAKEAAAVLAVLSAAFGYAYLRPRDKTHYLLVSTNDGVLSRFTGPKREMLDEVREIIAQKINTSDHESSYSVDFETGTIEDLRVKEVAGLHDGSAISSKGAPPANGLDRTAKAVNGANGHSAATGTAYGSNGVAANGNDHYQGSPPEQPVNGTYIDFSDFLPAIVEMHRFYARQPNAEHLEQRLSEMEMLMRAGATGAHQKQRVRELAEEVSQILQAYPSAVQMFQNIADRTS